MKLYVGAGKDRKEGYKHADIIVFPGIDYVFDATERWPFDDNTITEVYTQDFLEHIPQERVIFVIQEIYRILEKNGRMEHNVPNAGSMNDFGSPTHLSHWNLWTFEHFQEDSHRFKKDREFMGWKYLGGFKKILAEEWNHQNGIAQNIHVIYEKL